ncbi:MAG: hypothetical protein AAFX87_27570 [Bacteroidota bacterium]
MKSTLYSLIICLFTFTVVNAQDYPFIPDSLQLISQSELMKNPPPVDLDPVYFEDGTKTTLQEVMPLIMQQKLKPLMFVDAAGNYRALVVVKPSKKRGEVAINYENIPESMRGLGYSFGNPKSDTIIIHTQIGPMMNLLTEEFKSIFTRVGGLDESKYFIINIHQFQTLNPKKLSEKEISFDEAKAIDKESSRMLKDLVSYFKSENKTVYVVGLSFGAFAGMDFIAKYGNIADGYLFMVGRLDMTEKVWQSFSQGIEATFDEDASTVIIGKKPGELSTINLNKIAAGFGHNRYTALLRDTNLSNVIYYHGKKDQSVGKLTDKEIEFLESREATVKAFDGGHNQTLDHLKEGLTLLLQE